MSFGLTAIEYLNMLKEEHADFCRDNLCVRRAISCSVFANHMPEIVCAEYKDSDPAKLDCYTNPRRYREYVIAQCTELGIIQDLCDYGKHGPVLERHRVRAPEQVRTSTVEKTMELDATLYAFGPHVFGLPSSRDVDALMVTLRDGTKFRFDACIARAIEFWEEGIRAKAI